MAKMRSLLILLLVIASIPSLFAYTWPTEDAQVLENFGQRVASGSMVARGLRLRTQEDMLQPIETGEILFSQDAQSLIPSRSSGTVLVAHEEELYSVYTSIDYTQSLPASIKSAQVMRLFGEDVLALSTNVYELYLFDSRVRRYVNPGLFLSLGRMSGRVIVDQLVMVNALGERYPVYNGAVLPSMEGTLYASIYTLNDVGSRLAVREVSLQVLGNSVGTLDFSSMREEGGLAYLSEGKPVMIKKLYNEEGLLNVASTQLLEGQLNMVLRVTTVDGQVQENTMRIRVVN
ncbi:hypothetical protein [Entomospira culicis]|uniref:Uncharacterized protein n=1 Tax=Entomospira culicis TaxID=2719989 RepID=A0A968GIR9_9SPIO|nr:hypothetical protein [Entomospira culicis]NIZ68620.1 hypothetical protein [Entomospira culicis]WDI37220.1 hypothetical protein PVA46_00070 [Entomospira culicis]WDI38848.1 hypothetical protein PVA47_00080 [Entomospira culicis]